MARWRERMIVEDLLGGGLDQRAVAHGEEDLLDGVGAGEVAGDGVGDEDGLLADLGLPEGVDALLEDADDDEGNALDGDGVVDGVASASRRAPWRRA